MENSNYKKKYLKYKLKYIKEKEKIDNNYKQLGGILTYNCSRFYNNNNDYCFESRDEMIDFLRILVKSTKWNNTVLAELANIDFDIDRYEELPELVKLVLNIKPKPAHLLEMLLPKKTVDYLRKLLVGDVNTLTYVEYLTSVTIKQSINADVLQACVEILYLSPDIQDISEANMWKNLSKLIEFISCLLSSPEIKYLLGSNYEELLQNIENLPVKFVVLDDLILYKTNVKQLYPDDTQISLGSTPIYNNFILKDFFMSSNTYNCIPPSALLLLSVKLNPNINNIDNYYNILFRNLLQYYRVECGYTTQRQQIHKMANDFNNERITLLRREDSVLLDRAITTLLSQEDEEINIESQGRPNERSREEDVGEETPYFVEQLERPIQSVQPVRIVEQELPDITDYTTVFRKINLQYKKLIEDVQDKAVNLSVYLSRLNILARLDKTKRIRWLETEIDRLTKKRDDYISRLPKASNQKRFMVLPSEHDTLMNKIREKNTRIRNYSEELDLLKRQESEASENKINYILSKIIILIGVGIDDMERDICTGSSASNITWRTFNTLLKITEGNLFRIINFTASNKLVSIILQYVTPYSTYLPINFNTYLHERLDMNPEQKISFDRKYQEFEINLFTEFVHTDGYYYVNLKPNGVSERITNALTPPPIILNRIVNIVG